MSSLQKKIIQKLVHEFDKIRIKNKPKYFCIGMNKTGTTSVMKAFKQFGFVVGNQRKGELLMKSYFEHNFDPIIRFCRTGEFFQDLPFSCPETFKYLDLTFPNSKFILTIRDSSEQWYESLVKFHSKLYGDGKVPSVDALKKVDYVAPGWTWEGMKKMHNITENDDPYNKERMIKYYTNHNKSILNYFKNRPNDLLVLNVSETGSYQRLANFVGIEVDENETFPWENKT